MNAEIKCSLETRVSNKGKEYTCLVIYLTDTYKKIVFLENAELELVKQFYNI